MSATAAVAKLVDALRSGRSSRKGLRVQISPAAQNNYKNMEHLFFILFLFLGSFAFAKVEIAIEGAKGWAENLPTWRLPQEHIISRIFFGGRPATGYHTWLNIFIILIKLNRIISNTYCK